MVQKVRSAAVSLHKLNVEDFEKTEPAKKKQNTKGSNQSKGRKTPSAKAPKAKSLKTPEGTTKNKVLNKIIVSIDFGTTYSGKLSASRWRPY